MKEKLDTKPIYREGMDFLQNTTGEKSSRFLSLYSDFLNDLKDYWVKKEAIVSMDIAGVTNVITSISILLSNSEKIDDKYFEDLIGSFSVSSLKKYVLTKEQ